MYISIRGRIRQANTSGNGENPRVRRAVPRIPRLVAIAAIIALPVVAQSPGAPGSPPHMQNRSAEFPFDAAEGPNDQIAAKRIAMLNVLRQKAIVSDAEKLLELAKQLNDDANAGGSILSLPEKMHKAAEIEKLAKNVRDKMTYTVGTPSPLIPNPSFPR